MEFITSNKITPTDIANYKKSDIFQKKKAVTPTPRKNSPLPYHRGRKSAFSKLYNQTNYGQISPKSLGGTQREEISKYAKKSKEKAKNSFIVYGSATHKRKNSA